MDKKNRFSNSLRRPTMAVVILALSAAGLATSSNAASATTPSKSIAHNKAIAAAHVAAAKIIPTFKANPAVNMKSLNGKTIIILAATLGVPFVANIAASAKEAAGIAGWNATIIDGKGSVTEWSRVVNQAISQKVDGILTVGASPAAFKPAVAAAKAAGIPVVDVLTADQSRDPLIDGTFAHVSVSFYNSGKLQADYVIANGKPDTHVLIFGDNEFPGEVTRVQGMKDEFKKLCPTCKVTFRDTQVAALGTNLQPTTQTLLRKDPKIQWVLPTYDAQALYIMAGIKTAGLASSVKVVGSDAVSGNLDTIAKGGIQVADVGEPDVWSGWAGVDMMARALTHLAPVQPNIPLRLFDQHNLKGLNTTDTSALFGGSFRAEYKKIWGLS